VLICGGAKGALRMGRDVKYAPETPMNNLFPFDAGRGGCEGEASRRFDWPAGSVDGPDVERARTAPIRSPHIPRRLLVS
jgi:hypothetical protein